MEGMKLQVEKNKINVEKNYFYENNMKKSRKVNKIKLGIFSVFAIILIIIIAYSTIGFISNPTDTFLVTTGEISEWESVTAYIVRDEITVQGENYKNGMIRIKEEGERVAKGDSIYRYYTSGEEQIKEKIAEIDNQIQEIMQNQKTVFPRDIKLLESQIEEQIAALDGENSIQKIKDYKNNINTYINKKAEIAGEYSPANSELKQLIEQKNQYKESLTANAEYVNAPESGVVSYRVDGLENVLTPQSFGTLDKKFLENLNLKTSQIIPTSEETGKIINNYECYIILNSKSEQSKGVNVGDDLKIRLPNSVKVSAEIVNIIEEDDESRTIAIKISENVEDLIPYRKISIDIIWWSEEGFRVPNEAIYKIGELSYVIRNRNGYYDKMLVKIQNQNEEFSIVSSYSSDELKELGFSSSEIYSMKNIALYDEIVLNPTEQHLLQ